MATQFKQDFDSWTFVVLLLAELLMGGEIALAYHNHQDLPPSFNQVLFAVARASKSEEKQEPSGKPKS